MKIYLVTIILLASCQNAIKDKAVIDKEEPGSDSLKRLNYHIFEPRNVTEVLTANSPADLIGYWVGFFEPDVDDSVKRYINTGEHVPWQYNNKINLSIDSISDSAVLGHSVVAGNRRPFSGSIRIKNDIYHFVVKEPGDDQYDGSFEFSIPIYGREMKGTWVAYKKIETPKRRYTLNKRIFKYDAENALEDRYVDWNKYKTYKYEGMEDSEESDYDRSYFATSEMLTEYNPSLKLLTAEEVENLTKADIFVLRNSIYARHGYSFKNRQLRAYFDMQSWYIPVHTNIKNELTEIEKKNIKILLRYEKNAEEYYDEFGRG